ncbi:hypothetical protein F4804DRAFT_312819 [Jackrogersella minutella]|nr:hypothetical protein F4804DRAFT_312819 [Jackrogersella minutella]
MPCLLACLLDGLLALPAACLGRSSIHMTHEEKYDERKWRVENRRLFSSCVQLCCLAGGVAQGLKGNMDDHERWVKEDCIVNRGKIIIIPCFSLPT